MQSIETKFIGQTNTKPSRIKAFTRSDKPVSITVSKSFDLDDDQNHDRAAMLLCKKLNWSGPLMKGATQTGNVYVFDAHANRVRFEQLEFVIAEKGK